MRERYDDAKGDTIPPFCFHKGENMKKIISLALALIFVFTMLTVSASAADEAKLTYKVKWSSLSYSTYWYNQNEGDMDEHYTVTIKDNSIDCNGRSDNERRSYVANERVQISSDTKFEYVFQAKNHTYGGSAGVVFAFADGIPYFVYGSFDNSSDDAIGQSDIRVQKGLNAHGSHDCETGFTRSYITVDLDSDGFGTYKVVIDGYTASFYALTNAASKQYDQIGGSITLPSDAVFALGLYNRENNSSGERTVMIRNAVVYAMNDAAARSLSVLSDGSAELLSYIARLEKEYPREDFETESFYEFLDSLTAAKKLIEDGDYSAVDIADAREAIDATIPLLEILTPDFTKLNEIIGKAKALKAADCNPIAYKMLMAAVADAEELLSADDLRQSQVNEAVAVILDRYKEIDPNITVGDTPTDEPAGDVVGDASDNIGYTDIVGSDAIVELPPKGGCGSAILASSALTVVALIGTAAIVSKKKEN